MPRKTGVLKTFKRKNRCGAIYKVEKRRDPGTGKIFYRALNTAGEYLQDYKNKSSATRRAKRYADSLC